MPIDPTIPPSLNLQQRDAERIANMDRRIRELETAWLGPGPAWLPYTPTWTGSSTNPALGNGTIAGRYIRIGKLVFARVLITMGGTTTYGTGYWKVSLPVTPLTGHSWNGVGLAYDVSAGAAYPLLSRADTSNSWHSYRASIPAELVTVTMPFTWAAGDIYELNIFYEAA